MGNTASERVQGGFAEFEQTAEDISRNAATQGRRVVGKASREAHRATAKASTYADAAWTQIDHVSASAAATIRDRPMTALLLAGAAGLVVGMLTARGR